MKNGQRKNAGAPGLPPGYWHDPFKGERTQEYQPGSPKGGKDNKTVRKAANDFLTVCIKPIPITLTEPLYSVDNYMYLYESAKNYATLLGKDFSPEVNPDDFNRLYNSLNRLLPQEHQLDITAEDEDLYFIVTDDRSDSLMYYIPLNIISESKGKLQAIYRSFFALLSDMQGITPINIDSLSYYLEREINEVEKLEWEELKKNYKKGHVHNVFSTVAGPPEYDLEELKRIIRKHRHQDQTTKSILKLMLEGLELFDKGKVFEHTCSPIEDEYYYESFCPIDIRSLLCFIYDPGDLVTRKLEFYIQEEMHEQGCEFLVSEFKRLSPQDKKPLEESTFLISFINWLKRFNYELRNR